jgi:tripartite-type tricarboxylate transporter receptor subunit TctC
MTASRFLRLAASRTLGLAVVLVLAAPFAHAQSTDYPNRPIKLVVGFAAGGSTDVAARIMAQKMSPILGQTVLVENRTGASGLLAAEDVAKSPPDGYTLMMASQTVLAVAPRLYRKATIDPVKDFADIAYCGASPLVLVVNPSFPAHTVADVIRMARAEPGKITFGTGGVGTTPHIASELFQYVAGIKMAHIPYRGEAGAINDLIAGQIPAMFANLSAITGQLQAGTLRAIAVTSPQRAPTEPDVPTVAETLPGYAADTWFGLIAPAGTPQSIIATLNAAAKRALADPDTKTRYAEIGMTNAGAGGSSPEELAAYIKSETAKWAKVIADANIQPID